MGEVLKVDRRGRVTLPVTVAPYSLMPLWVGGVLFLVDNKIWCCLTVGDTQKLLEEIEKYRVKGLPYDVPRTYEPTNRLTIPKQVRVSEFWDFEETTFRFKSIGKAARAYKLTPLKVVPFKEVVVCYA